MLYFSNLKIFSVLAVIIITLLFAVPNFFGKDQLETFPNFFPKQQVNLGLDLQGGSHLLLEVDTEEIINNRIELYKKETGPVVEYFRKKDNFISVTAEGGTPEETAKEIIRRIDNGGQ